MVSVTGVVERWWRTKDGIRSFGGNVRTEELVPVTLRPPQVPRGLAWDRSLAAPVRLVIVFPITVTVAGACHCMGGILLVYVGTV